MKASGAMSPANELRHLARLTFVAFLLTFTASRTLVILIMGRKLPDLFLHMGGTHVHHLNYGIFLLSAVAGVLLFAPLNQAQRSFCALLYGVGLALTFDEFGMWLHLGGGYWQRASFDAIVVIAALLGMITVAPGLPRFRPRHWFSAVLLAAGMIVFGVLLKDSFRYAHQKLLPRMQELEK